ncbi:hypothetical protein S83_047079, partial [Arachis hypogaea]
SKLSKYLVVAVRLLVEFDSVSIKHIFRESNQEANELAQMDSGYKISPRLIKQFSEIETNLTPLKVRGVFYANALDPNDWRYKIIDFLKNSNQIIDRKIKYLVLSFVLVGGDLFKKNFD